MGIDFNVDEVFEIAEQIERNGAKFYRSVAQKITETDKKQLLIDLAEMEDEHEQTFKSLRSKLSTDEKIQTTFDQNVIYEHLLTLEFFTKKRLTLHHLRRYLNLQLQLKKTRLSFI